jgi:hypothetical protein
MRIRTIVPARTAQLALAGAATIGGLWAAAHGDLVAIIAPCAAVALVTLFPASEQGIRVPWKAKASPGT